jgi:NADPH:quinone reductase-like Zn-dependent oxidoreductase
MTLPATMRAVLLTGHGDLDALRFEPAWPRPDPAADEVLIRVDACGINNTDINTRVGWYAQSDDDSGAWSDGLTFPVIQGADVAGEIVAVGDDVDAGRIGERVLVDTWIRDPQAPLDHARARYLGSELDGGYADYLVVPAVDAYATSSDLSAVELASFATAAGTASDMIERTAVGPGERVLVTGASGGVGGYAVQIAAARGAQVVGVCSSDKAAAVRDFGAAATIDRGADPRHALAALGIDGVEVIVDVVGGPTWPALIDALRPAGRYVVSGAIAGPMVELDLRTLYLRDLTLIGATLNPPDSFGRLVAMIERGELRPSVAATFPLDRIADAQRAFMAKEFAGKIVLDLALGRA